MLNLKQLIVHCSRLVSRLHRDQRGTMSIVTVFSVMLLAALLGMIINIGRHADRKVQLQNGADSATYSGGVVLARSMNSIVFTNHLLCDVFAMTAYMREARDRNAEEHCVPMLDAWEKLGPIFSKSTFQKFRDLGPAIPQKVALEREMIFAFSEMSAAMSEQTLPVMETILEEELIADYQYTMLVTGPQLAQRATDEIAERHGNTGLETDEAMRAMLWRTDVTPVGSDAEMVKPTLPVVDPVNDISDRQPIYMEIARKQREDHANKYLRDLNNSWLRDLDRLCKMSQFSNIWRGFTCGYLKQLLEEEYPDRNMPFVIRQDDIEMLDENYYLEQQFMFVGVAYWKQMPERLPGLFKNPLDNDYEATYAQIHLFLPETRLRHYINSDREWPYGRNGFPRHWDMMNQNWGVKLVPATSPSVPVILQTSPPGTDVDPQNIGGLSYEAFQQLNTH